MHNSRLKRILKNSRLFRLVFFVPLFVKNTLSKYVISKAIKAYGETVVGGQVIVRPRNINGQFNVSATSALAKRVITTGVYEPELTSLFDRLSTVNGDVINIGANVGFYAIHIARTFPDINKVYAIEPNPEAYENLKSNVILNGCQKRVDTFQVCIGEASGSVEFAFIPGMPEYSSVGQIVHSSVKALPRKTSMIQVAPLDDVLPNTDLNPKLLVIDTEGAELLVLKGAQKTLRKYMPLLIFECEADLLSQHGHSSEMLEAFLATIGYTMRNAFNPESPLRHPFSGEAMAFPSDQRLLLSNTSKESRRGI